MTGPSASLGEGDPWAEAALVDTVVALRNELQGLRSAAQFRATIEQAKGVLVERHHITLDEAFDHLRAMSQEHNVRLVEVAATVVGVTLADSPAVPADLHDQALRSKLPPSPAVSPTWRALTDQKDIRAGVLAALIDSVAGSARRGDEVAELLVDLLAPHAVAAATLYRCAGDGSLRLVGQSGVPMDVVSSWHSIPPSPDIPYVRACAEDRVYFWADRAERVAQFTASASSVTAFEASAVVPVHDGGPVVGVVGLMWGSRSTFDAQQAAAITETAERVARVLMRNATEGDPEMEWIRALLRLHLDPWLLLAQIPGSERGIPDLVVQDASSQLDESGKWLGRRLVELWPTIVVDGIGQALAELVRSGGSWGMTVAVASDGPWGTPGSRVRAVRLGRYLVLVWRPVTA